jgi:hypothetical protein
MSEKNSKLEAELAALRAGKSNQGQNQK